MYSVLGFLVSLMSLGFFALIVYRRIAYGPEAEGLFTLFAIAFLLLGVALFGIGLLGEYVGRIYQQVRERPRYLIQAILEADEEAATHEAEKQMRSSRGQPRPACLAPRAALMSSAVVFAYHNVGVRCLSVLLAHGLDVRAGGHARGPARREHLVRERRGAGAAARISRGQARRPQRLRHSSREIAAVAPDFLFSFYYRMMLTPALLGTPHARCPEHARLAAASLSRPGAGQLGRDQG